MNPIQIKRQLQLATESGSQLKVAFASSDQHQVDQHFASSRRFAIYGLDKDHQQLLKIIDLTESPGQHQQQNIDTRLELLSDCLAVYVVAVGDAVVRQLWAHGIRPVRVVQGSLITTLLSELRQELNRQSSPLRRQMHRDEYHPENG